MAAPRVDAVLRFSPAELRNVLALPAGWEPGSVRVVKGQLELSVSWGDDEQRDDRALPVLLEPHYLRLDATNDTPTVALERIEPAVAADA